MVFNEFGNYTIWMNHNVIYIVNILILFVHKYLMLNFIFYSTLDIAALLLLVVFVLTGAL